LSDKYAATRPIIKGGKKRASRVSKIDRLSTQSSVTTSQPEPIVIDLPEVEDDVNDSIMTTVSTATTTTKGKKARGRPKKKIAVIEDDDVALPADSSVLEPSITEEPVKPPPKQTKRKTSRQVSAQKKAAPKATRGKKRATNVSVEETQEEPVEDALIENTIIHKPARGVKRTSDGTPKASRVQDSSIIILEDPPSEKPKRQKRTKKVDVESQTSETAQIPTKSKKAKTSSIRQPLGELNPRDVAPPPENSNTPKSAYNNDFNIPSDPPTPTPARTRLTATQRQSIRSGKTDTPRASTTKKAVSSSPQSSDAENKPPSTRPSVKGLVFQPVSPLRPIPMNALTPAARASPSKRHIVSRLQTQVAWEPAELDAIFTSFSPSKSAAVDNKENRLASIDISKLDKQRLLGVVEAVKANMTEEEKGMTVEQWVRWNAQKSEDKMKKETETMITMFEREATKAQRALEAVNHRA
jgi:hypothetical protein